MLPKEKHLKLSGWGKYPSQQCPVYRPERQREVAEILAAHQSSIIARGAGRSGGDAAINWEGVISTERLRSFLDFDAHNGIIKAQSGVTLKEVMDVTAPLGWFPPVLPDTKYATLGGCFACNVHGRNAWKEGEFARHVLGIKLRKSSGELVECSPHHEASTFWATAGGLGLTGIIEEVTLQLRPIASSSIEVESFRTHSLEEMIYAFRDRAATADYMSGWVNHFGRGKEFGKGIFESARHLPAESGKALFGYKADELPKPMPASAPLANGLTLSIYNNMHLSRHKQAIKTRIAGLEASVSPLDRYADWYKLFGPKGLLQYQFILPDTDDVAHRIQFLLEALQQSRQYAYFTTIQYHAAHEGMLSFGMKGFSVSLDIPNSTKALTALDQIDALVADYGGRVYLGKDARLKSENLYRMYAQHIDEWMRVVHELDPERKMGSALSRRLKLRGM